MRVCVCPQQLEEDSDAEDGTYSAVAVAPATTRPPPRDEFASSMDAMAASLVAAGGGTGGGPARKPLSSLSLLNLDPGGPPSLSNRGSSPGLSHSPRSGGASSSGGSPRGAGAAGFAFHAPGSHPSGGAGALARQVSQGSSIMGRAASIEHLQPSDSLNAINAAAAASSVAGGQRSGSWAFQKALGGGGRPASTTSLPSPSYSLSASGRPPLTGQAGGQAPRNATTSTGGGVSGAVNRAMRKVMADSFDDGSDDEDDEDAIGRASPAFGRSGSISGTTMHQLQTHMPHRRSAEFGSGQQRESTSSSRKSNTGGFGGGGGGGYGGGGAAKSFDDDF
jgi:hypothetical protein